MEPEDSYQSDHEKEKIERLRRAMYSRELSDKIQDRPRHSFAGERPIVGEDWKRPDPGPEKTIVAPKTMQIARDTLRWVLVGSIAFFVIAIGFFAYYFTLGGGAIPASPRNIDINIAGPLQITGGEPTQLQITVTNRNKVPLELSELVITYPDGTRSPVDLSTELKNQRIPLNTIDPGDKRQGTVSAVFAGNDNDVVNVKVDLEYRLEGSSAIFVASSEYNASFGASALTLNVNSNLETISGQPVEFTITVGSNAAVPVKDVLLAAEFPFGFTFTSASPAVSSSGLWELGDINPGQQKEITVRGTLKGESGDERVFRFTTGTRNSKDSDTITTQLANSSFSMKVAEPFLGLAMYVNGRSTSKAVVAPGSNVKVSIRWQNNLSTPITDAVVVARIAGLQLNPAAIDADKGFYRSTDSTVIWDKTTVGSDLANIPAGGDGVVEFTFQVPDDAALSNVKSPSVTISVNASGKRVAESGVPENLQSSAVQRIELSSTLAAEAHGYYYANPFGSTGPLPPKAEVETTYAIVFSVTNTTNPITNARMTASLPPYIRWTGIRSEDLSFNQSDGTVTWNIGTVDPGVGIGGSEPRRVVFTIGFTPSQSQIGSTPPLITNIRFVGYDSSRPDCETGGFDTTPNANCVVTLDLNPVTTNITGDTGFNSSQATVVK